MKSSPIGKLEIFPTVHAGLHIQLYWYYNHVDSCTLNFQVIDCLDVEFDVSVHSASNIHVQLFMYSA